MMIDGRLEDKVCCPPTFELKMRIFLINVQKLEILSPESLKEVMQGLVKQYIDEISISADFEQNDEILEAILATDNFREILCAKIDDYVVRKHIRDIMRCYLQAVGFTKKISVKDEVLFGLQMSSIGLNISLPTKRESDSCKYCPDGNVAACSSDCAHHNPTETEITSCEILNVVCFCQWRASCLEFIVNRLDVLVPC